MEEGLIELGAENNPEIIRLGDRHFCTYIERSYEREFSL